MPLLPSGLNLYISNALILEPNNNLFECPEGHFWYQSPDLAINRPPFEPGRQIIMDFVHAPLPQNREEVKQYIQILIGLDGEDYYWRGDMLSDFPASGELEAGDLAVWNEWLESDSITGFLDLTIEKCRIQAESNRDNSGIVFVRGTADETANDSSELRLRQIGRRVSALESEADAARLEGDEERGREIYDELETLLDETLNIRRRLGREGGVGAFLEGHLNRLLHRWSAAEDCFREYLRSVPFHVGGWMELTRCLAAQDDHAEAEIAARRAVKLAPEIAGAWAILALALAQLGEYSEARQALDTALELDSNDEKILFLARHLDLHFDDQNANGEAEVHRLQEEAN